MEWVILIVLVPLVLVPIVLLFGFAGCEKFGEAPADSAAPPAGSVPSVPSVPSAPFNLQAAGISTDEIDLTWQHNSAGSVNFLIGRQRADGTWDDSHGTTAQLHFEDKPLPAGTPFTYRVKATLSGINSDPSNQASASTLTWRVAYENPLTANDGAFKGNCLVQRIDKALLKYSGTKVKITLQAFTTQPLVIDQISISRAVPAAGIPGNPTPSPWDSNQDLKLLGGANLAAYAAQVLGPIDYVLDNSQDLILAFDIDAANGGTRKATTNVGASSGFTHSAVAEAAVQNRSNTGYATRGGAVYLVEKIEVLTA